MTPEKWGYLHFSNRETKLRSRLKKEHLFKDTEGYDELKCDHRSLGSCVLELYESMKKG